MDGKIGWGILGTGKIAAKFTRGLRFITDGRVAAVGSRSAERAKVFAKKFNVPNSHGSYEQLVNDPGVDAVYVATAHPFHMENTILALKAGKAVLCEKPFAVNAGQARAMIETARSEKKFLMEAMWTRFIPLVVELRGWLSSGLIGQVRMMRAEFGFRFALKPQSRILNAELAGGALLDVGIYPLSFASMIFGGKPQKVSAISHIGSTGVDEQSAVILRYDQGQLACFTCAVRTETSKEALIYGTEGSIRLAKRFFCPTRATISTGRWWPRRIRRPIKGDGMHYQVLDVHNCLKAGKLESDIMPLDESLEILETADEIRRQCGLKYPFE
ncbi:MAG: Gfo/Idh/MocA family protein [Planctomycetota bacterium]|jgi:predicted dehydrogenase